MSISFGCLHLVLLSRCIRTFIIHLSIDILLFSRSGLLGSTVLHTSKICQNRRKNGEANGFMLSRPLHEYSDYLIFLIHATMDEGRLIFQKIPWIASVEILEIVRIEIMC